MSSSSASRALGLGCFKGSGSSGGVFFPASRACAVSSLIGCPQDGQESARSETERLHSGQLIKGMAMDLGIT